MKKLNFNNQCSEDDEKLVKLLKTSIGQAPSEQFTERTLEKFMVFKTKQKNVHKPLKSPLYMMLIIGLILLIPVFLTLTSQIPFPDSRFRLENISFQLDAWYILSTILLLLVLMGVVWAELSVPKFFKTQ